jgi:aryl-alcohol dehydrogenase-like predicted oxidoreductase
LIAYTQEVVKLEYRKLGKTGLKVSKLGFGGIPIRGVSEEQAVAVVNRALDLGVNFIHTSVTYGDSTQKICKVLEERRDECILALKIGGGRTKRHAEERLRESFEALKVDHIEVAELPINATDFPKAMGPGGAYEAFLDAREEGVIDHIGITGHDIDFLTEAIETEAFSNVIAPYNYVANKAEEGLFSLARDLNLGIMAMKVLGVGGIPEVQKALRYVWHDDVDMAIIGMSTIEEVEENVEVANDCEPLTDEERSLLREISERIHREKRLKFSGKITQSHAEGVTSVILRNIRH